MRFEQTRDILHHLVAPYHRSVSRLCREFAGLDIGPRNRLMLEYLVDHELRLALAIHDFLADAPEAALDYWFKGIALPFPTPAAATLTDACRHDLDQLVGAAISFKTPLLDYYDHLLATCDAAEPRHLFATLRAQEEKSMKRLIRHAQGLADL
jgi:hypothetical protein